MSGLSTQPYKGTRDFFPQDKRYQDYIFEKWTSAAKAFGFENYDGPLLEDVELYKAKSGEELINEQIYSFYDRGERFVAIRPEMTPTLARMVAQIYKEAPLPLRWFSIPNLYRYEKPQRGRLREHWQFNIDIFGASKNAGEMEILQLAVFLMESFGANETMFELLINDRHIVDATFENLLKLNQEQTYKLYKIVDKSKKVSREDLAKMLAELNLDQQKEKIFYQYLDLKSFDEAISFLQGHGLEHAASELRELTNLLNTLGIEKYLTYDPTIVRGLDYYTGMVFELFDKHPENRRAICGGGSYANLLGIFNEGPLAGIGLGMGDVTLSDFLKTHQLMPDLSKPDLDIMMTAQVEEALIPLSKLAILFRQEGFSVVMNYGITKLKKAFPLAQKRGAKFIVLMGQQELEKNQIVVKNLEMKEQKEFNYLSDQFLKELIQWLG